MARTVVPEGADLLGWWLNANGPGRRTRIPRQRAEVEGVLRFALYVRGSTKEFQDPVSSATWQREAADELVEGHGRIVVEFREVGVSRRVGWAHRPEASRLLTALADPSRGFDAIVVGEFERAFHGEQWTQLAPVFAAHGVQLWLPELNGPFDAGNEMHVSLVKLLGVHSRREVWRAQFRAKAAMRAQVAGQGRHLGGRPPYGYRLVDAGPHPNAAHARWGRRLQRLEPDPNCGPVVCWIFAQRLAGHTISSITRDLNDRGVPCPSAVDPVRNPHRPGDRWCWSTVSTILANPRYTGRQVWNRQHREYLDVPPDDLIGRSQIRQRNRLEECVLSDTLAHPPLVSEADFVAAQSIYAKPAITRPGRAYELTSRVLCGGCGRRLTAHWIHNRPGYRCRHGRTTADRLDRARTKIVYAREDQILLFLARHLPQLDGSSAEPGAALAERDVYVRCGPYTWQLQVGGRIVADEWPPHIAPVSAGPRRRPERQA